MKHSRPRAFVRTLHRLHQRCSFRRLNVHPTKPPTNYQRHYLCAIAYSCLLLPLNSLSDPSSSARAGSSAAAPSGPNRFSGLSTHPTLPRLTRSQVLTLPHAHQITYVITHPPTYPRINILPHPRIHLITNPLSPAHFSPWVAAPRPFRP